MKAHVLQRIEELITRGNATVRSVSSEDYWMRDIVAAQSWMASAANAIQQIAIEGSFFRNELDRLMSSSELKGGIPLHIVEKVLGLLQSIHLEAKAGLLTRIEDQIVATAFDDFLDHSSEYHKSGKGREAAVLASAVLEDTIKRISSKNNIDVAGRTLDPLIDILAKNSVISMVKAKRMKSYTAIRNHALHAEWEKLDIKEIGELITGIRELLDEYLSD